jgi:multidrug efflux pump subunit AcrA (membrane-fusion protein)
LADRQLRRRARRRRQLAGAAGLAVVAAGGGLGLAFGLQPSARPYRTAVAAEEGVVRTLDVTGIVSPVTDASVGFETGGTVQSVAVAVGQTVTAGQTLATLDSSSLQAQVNADEEVLAAAQANLVEDQNDEATAAAPATAGAAATAAAPATAGAQATASETSRPASLSVVLAAVSPGPPPGVSADQQAVIADQHTVDLDLQTAAADLTQMEQACGTSTSSPTTSTSTTTSTSSPTTSTSTTSTTSTTAGATPGSSAAIGSTTNSNPPGSPGSACATDLQAAGQAETKVAADQSQLASAESSLAQALAAEASSGSRTPSSGSGPGGGEAGANSGGAGAQGVAAGTHGAQTGTGASTSPLAVTDSPEQLASDQATIDDDTATLVNAEQELTAATLTSPVAGTVEAVGIYTGEKVTAGSQTETITVQSVGSYEVTADLTTSQVQGVSPGQSASLTFDSVSGTFAGRVASVEPVLASSSSYTFPVVISLSSPTGPLPVGSRAHASIVLGQADGALAVPTSAVHTANGSSYVLVDRSDREVRTAVKVGLVGPVYTQILSGLTAGQVVILADPSLPVPASSNNPTPGRLIGRLGGAGFGGAGFGGTGFGGGGFGGGRGGAGGRAASGGGRG